MSKRSRAGKSTRGQSSRAQETVTDETIRELWIFESENHQLKFSNISRLPIHPGDVIDWGLLTPSGMARDFFQSINTDPFTGPQWANMFQMNEPIYRELVWEFFATLEFEATACRYNSGHVGVKFRLGREEREMTLVEFGWRVGLYSERVGREEATRVALNRGATVKADMVTMAFWPTIGDGEFLVGSTVANKIRDPRVRLAHRCIATTISGRRESTQKISAMDLFFLYCIYANGVTCNIPFWLVKYLKKDKSVICGGMFVTRLARSFGLLSTMMVDALHQEPRAHVYNKRSLVIMDVAIDLGDDTICWPAVRQPVGGDEVEDAADEGAGDPAEAYRTMSRGEFQVRQGRWMDQQDAHWGHLDTWMGQQDNRANWMYDHTVRQFEYLSTRDNLSPHLQIDPFPGRESDYPPYGYTGPMPPGYEYRPGPPPGGFH